MNTPLPIPSGPTCPLLTQSGPGGTSKASKKISALTKKKNTVVHSFTCSTYPNVPHRTLSSKLWVEHLKYFCDWVWLGTWRCFRIQADQTGELFIARLENKSRQHLLHLTKQSLLPSLFIFLETAIASLQAGPTAAARVEDETWKLNQETPAHICLLLSK